MGSDQVNKRSSLKPGSWEFAFSDMFVYVCEGAYIIPVFHPRDALNALVVALAFYSKEAGAGARHAWRESTTSIGAVSYAVEQAYEATGASHNQFHSLLNSQVKTHAGKAFLHAPATQFLCSLQDLPTPNVLGGRLTLSDADWLVFQKLAGTTLLREAPSKAIVGLNAAAQKKGIVE